MLTPVRRYCRLCGCHRAQHHFSGKGRKKHVCRDCMKLPPQERSDRLAMLEVEGFVWRQRNISAGNILRLKELIDSSIPVLSDLASVVLQIASVAPGRRGRLAKIQGAHLLLWKRMLAVNLVPRDDEGDDVLVDGLAVGLGFEDELGFDLDVTGAFGFSVVRGDDDRGIPF